jgi:hypothetical protein
MKKIVSIVLALVLALGLSSAVAFADVVKPTSHTSENVSHSGITSVTVAGTTAIFEKDSNTGDQVYIRAELPNTSATEYSLKHAAVVINATGTIYLLDGDDPVQYDSLVGDTYTYTLDLFNKAYTVTTGSDDYTLAAGIADGQVGISNSDPLLLSGTMANTSLNFYGSCQNNPYMGNPYYSSGWTFIGYYFTAALPSTANISNVNGSFTLATGASITGGGQTSYTSSGTNVAWNFSSSNAITYTNGSASRAYYPKLTVTGQNFLVTKAHYDFNFSELKGDTTYYVDDIPGKVQKIERAWNAYIGEGRSFNVGSSAMDVITAFISWAETNTDPVTNAHYFTGTSNTSDGTYLSRLNDLDYSDCGYMAGYMYSIDPAGYYWTSTSNHSELAQVGADVYTITDSTCVVWFYTTNFMNWYNW